MINRMQVNEKTKISELIKANSESVQAIAALSKSLQKLKNPILRKIMASRVTIAEAAKMGGVQVLDFRRALEPLGFVFENITSDREEGGDSPRPQWLETAAPNSIDFYDVRPIIEDGADPLKSILGRFKYTPASGILCVVNSFVPTPLIHLLKQEKAQDAYVETIASTEFHTYFLKKPDKKVSPSPESSSKLVFDDEASFANLLERFQEEQIQRIDVRALEMPGPMEAILAELESLQVGQALYVQHKRVPIYLLEELADRDYVVHVWKKRGEDVIMLIVRSVSDS